MPDPTYVCAHCGHQQRCPERPPKCEHCHAGAGPGSMYEFPPTDEGDEAAEELSERAYAERLCPGCGRPFSEAHHSGCSGPVHE